MRRVYWLRLSVVLLALLCGAASARTHTEECRQRLKRIHRALVSYQRDHGELPQYLSALVPQYLPDKVLLHCSADRSQGEPGYRRSSKDPRLPCSYSYEMSLGPSFGIGLQMGPARLEPDMTCRAISTIHRVHFGARVPVIRCYHHRGAAGTERDEVVLNLTATGEVYRSGVEWTRHPGAVAVALRKIEADLKAGAEQFKRTWYTGPIEQWSWGWIEGPLPASIRSRLRAIAGRLAAVAEELGSPVGAYQLAARFYLGAGDPQKAIAAAESALRLVGKDDDREEATLILADAYARQGRHRERIPLYLEMLSRNPTARSLMNGLADAYQAVGEEEKAREWRLKADRGRALMGQAAPDFEVASPSGGRISLANLLRTRKAVLINFWFYH
jgi:tetratricopeptide (TPR) repeat protein